MREQRVSSVAKSVEAADAAHDTPSRSRSTAGADKPTASSKAVGFPDIRHNAGNLAVQRLFEAGVIQAKLAITQPGDADEVEADRTADQVLAAPSAPGQAKCATCSSGGTTCPKCKQEESLQRKEKSGSQSAEPTAEVDSSISGMLHGGLPLSAPVREFFEPRFGRDLSGVRVHANNQAAQSTCAIQARAFTVGQNVVFGAGEYAPETSDGKRLLAHELTHTLQQSGKAASVAPPTNENSANSRRDTDVLAPQSHGPTASTARARVPASPRELAVQREPARNAEAIAAAAAASRKLDDDYRDALTKQEWERATVVLNGFSDKDIKDRVATLEPPLVRLAMLQAVPQWNFRVRSALLDREYREALARTDWTAAAIHLNGFNNEGIDERLAELPPGQASNIAVGAMSGMEGISQQRIVGAVERLQKTVDAKGGQHALGTEVISDVMRLQQQGASVATARATAFQQLRLAVSVGADSAKSAIQDRVTAVHAIAGAMAGAALVEPGMLSEGKIAHGLIGAYYAGLNPPSLSDPSLITLIRALKLTKAAYDALYAKLPEDLLVSLKMRPDIVDLGKMQVYEIKSVDSGPRAVPEMLDYIELLESFEIPGIPKNAFTFHPGSPANPGTSGLLPNPMGGWVVFTCPVPGAIIYRTLLPMENPRSALERLKNELKGASNMMVGVEGMTAISLALALSFEQLLPLLIEAAGAAGQAIPQIPKLAAEGAGQLNPAF